MRLENYKNGFYELKLGAYFRGFLPTFSGFLIIGCGLSLIIIAKSDSINFNTKVYSFIIIGILIGILVNLFMGIEGIEFDTNTRQFRKYKKRLGIKTGTWKSLEPYKYLCLSAQYNSVGGVHSSGGGHRHRSLEINLAGDNVKSILLAECENYKSALKDLHKLHHALNIEINRD